MAILDKERTQNQPEYDGWLLIDEEYPREDDDGHPGPFASINQIVAYYERQGIFNEEDDALGS